VRVADLEAASERSGCVFCTSILAGVGATTATTPIEDKEGILVIEREEKYDGDYALKISGCRTAQAELRHPKRKATYLPTYLPSLTSPSTNSFTFFLQLLIHVARQISVIERTPGMKLR